MILVNRVSKIFVSYSQKKSNDTFIKLMVTIDIPHELFSILTTIILFVINSGLRSNLFCTN